MEITQDYLYVKPTEIDEGNRLFWDCEAITKVKVPVPKNGSTEYQIGDRIRVAYNEDSLYIEGEEAQIKIVFAIYEWNEPIATQELMPQKDITMEQIKEYSSQENLLLEDLLNWNGLQEVKRDSSAYRQYYYEFSHMGQEFRLDFRSDRNNTIMFARLVDMQTMLSIDIRTGNIEHFLQNTVSMDDYLTFDLSQGVVCDIYDIFKGHFGGSDLEKNGDLCGSVLILDGSRVNPVIVDGNIVQIDEYDNNVYHKKWRIYQVCQYLLFLHGWMWKMKGGKTTEYYSIYFASESCFYVYNIRLRTDLFTKEEVLGMIETVRFMDKAFY